MSTAIAADPSTAPTWRLVLYTPEPAPASSVLSPNVVIDASGPHMQAFARPSTALGMSSSHTETPGRIMSRYMTSPAATSSSAKVVRRRGSRRSTYCPTGRARRTDSTAIGTSMSADWVGVRPSTS